ncbi:MAG: NADH-ubiquinone oxidoreductase-F iron-sulfur binding region domain-containing protein [Saprospiraceae bacterium]
MSKNLGELSGRQGLNNSLFEKIGIISEKEPSIEDFEKLAREFKMGTANVYGASTFYDFTKASNQGKKAYICNGSACLTAGTQGKTKEFLLKHFNENEIGEMCCLGRCYENNAYQINGFNYSGPDSLKNETFDGRSSNLSYFVKALGTNILTSSTLGDLKSIKEYITDLLNEKSDILLENVKKSNVRGRGGAGFPMHIKLESFKNALSKDGNKFVVCNADEGDPGAFSDRYLLEYQPYKVLFGMMMAGYIAGANWGVLYIRAEYPECIATIQKCIDDLTKDGFIGSHILNTNFSFYFKIIAAKGAYICGEETALISSIEGQRPEVRVRPPYPVQEGLFNKPTLVQNVETLACLPFIFKNGGDAFADVGTERSKGTKLVSLDGHVVNSGMYEVDMGTSLSTLIFDIAQGFKSPVKALHIGGPLGGLVPIEKINDLTIDFESFSEQGFLLGHASVVCIPSEFPLIQYLAHLFEFTAHESCGKCFPCRLGSVRGAELLHKAQHDTYQIDPELFYDLINTMEKGSLCALGGGLPLPIKNALHYFKSELSSFFSNPL